MNANSSEPLNCDTSFQPELEALSMNQAHTSPLERCTHAPDARVTANGSSCKGDFDLPTAVHYPCQHGTRRSACRVGNRGFTLVEVLATVLLMAIVVPVVDRGLAAATQSAGTARHRTEAAGLAQSKLSELTVNGLWQNGNQSGNFGPDWPEYTWQANVASWTGDTQEVGLQQLDVQVLWTARNKQESVTVSGLVYVRPQPSS